MFRTKKEPLIYSDEFRTAVLKAYPENDNIKALLKANEYFLGRYLDDCSQCPAPSLDPELIIEKIECGAIDELLIIAKQNLELVKLAQLKSEVYRMWDKECFLD